MNATPTTQVLLLDDLVRLGDEIIEEIQYLVRRKPGIIHTEPDPGTRRAKLTWREDDRSLHLILNANENYGLTIDFYRGEDLIYGWRWFQDEQVGFEIHCDGGHGANALNYRPLFLDLPTVADLPGREPTRPEMIDEIIKVVAEQLTNLHLV